MVLSTLQTKFKEMTFLEKFRNGDFLLNLKTMVFQKETKF